LRWRRVITSEKPNGFCVEFEVKEAGDKGLGVFAAESIKNGSIVWRHVSGQYTVFDESRFKALIGGMTHDEVVYELTHMFGLKGIEDCVIQVLDAGALINHSNSANLATNNGELLENRLDRTSDSYIQDVTEALLADQYALVATRDIERGEEFTTNYATECEEPPFFDAIYEQYGVDEPYLDDD
jgi:hypothetical protein